MVGPEKKLFYQEYGYFLHGNQSVDKRWNKEHDSQDCLRRSSESM